MENYHDLKTERKSCCFIGHRDVEDTEELRTAILQCVTHLIVNENVRNFHFGSRSAFDTICHSIVSNLQKKYRQPPTCIELKRIFYACKSEGLVTPEEKPKIDALLSGYYRKNISVLAHEARVQVYPSWKAGKASYIVRNQYMVDQSDFVVFYYDKNRTPPVSKNGKTNSGTCLVYDYAKKKKDEKQIINLCSIT